MKTDTELQKDVLAELKWEPSVNATHIGVEVSKGIVTLAGHVDSYAEKWGAEKAAQRVLDVKAVVVEMDVKLAMDSKRSDADIAQSVENALAWSAYLPANRVKVLVEKGWVTLTGDLDWEYQRQSTLNAIRYLLGVTGVSNTLTLKTGVSQTVVKSDIEAALNRRATADAKKIKVDVQGDEVTLSGTAQSMDERNTARHSAWGTKGVRNVVDNIAIAY